jgi:hypothetical protein
MKILKARKYESHTGPDAESTRDLASSHSVFTFKYIRICQTFSSDGIPNKTLKL